MSIAHHCQTMVQFFRRLFHARSLLLTAVSCMSFFLVLVPGICVIMWQASKHIETDTQSRLSRAVTLVDRAINHADHAATLAVRYSGGPCDSGTLFFMRKLVTITPDIRTINLATNDVIYCTSLFGPESGEVSTSQYFRGELLLLNGNVVTPYNSLLAFRKISEKTHNSVLVGIDGYYLQNTLELLGAPTPMQLKIGERWMDVNGRIHMNSPPDTTTTRVLTSEKYGFEVITTLPFTMLSQYTWLYAIETMALLLIISLTFSMAIYKMLNRQTTLIFALKQALTREQFTPYLQPIVDADTFDVVGAEVLMRWEHPKMGLVMPDHFIPLAEQCGLIIPMTEQIVEKLSHFVIANKNVLPDGFMLWINISAKHFSDDNLIKLYHSLLNLNEKNVVVPVFELTERELISQGELTEKTFRDIKKLGGLFSIDDFGTGNANLQYLSLYPVSYLKIDKLFTQCIDGSSVSAYIVENIISLAEKLRLKVVIEGVENQEQAEYFLRKGAHLMQGYHFGRPVPVEDFIDACLKR